MPLSVSISDVVDFWKTYLTFSIDATCAGISGTASAAEIASVSVEIEALISLVVEAKAACSGTLSLSGHTEAELAALVGGILLQVEYTASYAASVCGKGMFLPTRGCIVHRLTSFLASLSAVLLTLSTSLTAFVSVVCTVSGTLKAAIGAILSVHLSASTCVVAGIAALI